jgi:hypothetical protein
MINHYTIIYSYYARAGKNLTQRFPEGAQGPSVDGAKMRKEKQKQARKGSSITGKQRWQAAIHLFFLAFLCAFASKF